MATAQDRITIYGPKDDGTYIVEFWTAEGDALAISIPRTEAAVIRHFQAKMPYGWCRRRLQRFSWSIHVNTEPAGASFGAIDAQLDLNSAAGNTGSPHASLFARHWPSSCGVVEVHSWDHSTDF